MGAKQQGADAIQGRWLTIPRTLSFVFHGEDVLLMKRAPHKRVFPNQYNGLGGHIERDEDPYQSAIREIKEESGLDVHDVRLRAIHNIDSGQSTGIMLMVFSAQSNSREITVTSDEGTLHWIPIAQLSEYDLVEDIPLILPRIATMQPDEPPYFAHVSYDDNDQIVMRFTP
jgi:8-oxo-dGTP diphosphatase